MNTSYFAKYKGPNSVAICQGVPKWYKGLSYRDLAPSWDMLLEYRTTKNEERFRRRYKEEILSNLNPQKVLEDLGEDAVLLCWEGANDFCHRRVVAEWLQEKLGLEVKEL